MPKVIAKPLFLTVRPLQVANLCFEVGGILGESFTELGAKVSAFDFGHLYKAFRDANRAHAVDPGRVPFDSDGIDGQTKTTAIFHGVPFALAALRAETVKAALNKAITARANAVFTKYANAVSTVSSMRQVAIDNTRRLALLSENSQSHTDLLAAAYLQDGRIGVVRTTNSVIVSTLQTIGETKGPAKDDSQNSTSSANANETQRTENKDYGYRVPHLENLARNERAQISISDEQFSNFMLTQNLERLEEVYKNELASIDTDINQLQNAYLNTILMSPIDGIVTGVYKNPGDPVSAGEPVFRVENNDNVLIVAKISCRGPIVVGSVLQVKTTLFDSPDSPVTIEADVVAARVQGEDDQWEVIAKRSNLDAADKNKNIFPLGYSFDYDDTEITVFGPNEI